jgi:hypothetical protein
VIDARNTPRRTDGYARDVAAEPDDRDDVIVAPNGVRVPALGARR